MKKLMLTALMLCGAIYCVAADTAQKKDKSAKKPNIQKKKAPAKPKPSAKRGIGNNYSKFLSQLPEAERKKLENLYRVDHKKFQREIRARIAAWKKESALKENKESYKLRWQYLNTRDANKKKQIKAKLTALTKKQFYDRLKDNQRRIKIMERKLQDLKKKCTHREKNADKIVEERVDYLISDPVLRW